MNLHLFKSLWTHVGSLENAVADVRAANFDGLEGPIPPDPADRSVLLESAVPFIAEISTGTSPGLYVPSPRATPADHLRDLRASLAAALPLQPIKITVLAGSDLWPLSDSIAFLREARAIARDHHPQVSFETHRGRSTFHPLATAAILDAIPELPLTCDFSHWCVVTERTTILDELPDLLARCAANCHHLHARVGYDQGPQVPHPRAPEYADALAAHERWWDAIWTAQERRGDAVTTLTPESGPDGYLHHEPFTQKPVADLWEINRWMGHRQRDRFSQRHAANFKTSELQNLET